MDFTIKKYKELISALKDTGYEFVTYAEYCEGLRADKLVVMRHDVDRSVERARRLAEVENEMGVKASYYFREKFIGDDVVCIASLGHEVGYHYEELVTEKGDVERAYVRFMRNVCALRELVDVKTITMHGAPTSRFDSKEMWRVCDYKKLGLIGEPQFDVDWNDMFYLTDTGRSWNGVSRRDKVVEFKLIWKAKGWVYKTTDDVIKAVRNGSFPNRVMMTIHPQRWTDNMWKWFKELVGQSIKNFVKKFLLRIDIKRHE
jgi:hypothetical protein